MVGQRYLSVWKVYRPIRLTMKADEGRRALVGGVIMQPAWISIANSRPHGYLPCRHSGRTVHILRVLCLRYIYDMPYVDLGDGLVCICNCRYTDLLG